MQNDKKDLHDFVAYPSLPTGTYAKLFYKRSQNDNLAHFRFVRAEGTIFLGVWWHALRKNVVTLPSNICDFSDF